MADVHVSGARASGVDPTQPIEADKSLGELLSRLTNDFGELVSTQVDLAKVEIKEEVSRASKGAGMLGGSAFAAYLSILLLSFAAAWGLWEVMPAGFAFLIVGVLWGLVAAVLFVPGRKKLEQVRVPPPETKQSIQEDVEWAKRQKS
jgi:uncharacterized membrane protein YqjE